MKSATRSTARRQCTATGRARRSGRARPRRESPAFLPFARRLSLETLEGRCLLSADLQGSFSAGSPPDDAGHMGPLPLAGPRFAPGEIIVGFDGTAAAAYRGQGPAAALEAAGPVVAGFGLHSGRILAHMPGVPGAAGAGRLATHWIAPPGSDVLDLAGRLAALPGVAYAEPNYIVTVASTFPNDPQFGSLWGLHNTGQTVNGTAGTPDADIDAPEAWDIARGEGVVVAVIDTGIDYTHPDLAANVWTNPGEIPGNGLDDDGNGFKDDVNGYDFANHDADPFDDFGHGTHVSGTIAALANNAAGVAGVAWNTQIMALKFLDANGNGTTANGVAAINYATMMRRDYGVNVRLTSNSYVGPFSQAEQDAIQAGRDAGLLFVAAAGNSNSDNDNSPVYPASYPLENIISVAATDSSDARAGFSNYGANSVDLGAPGVNVLSTVPTSGSLGDPSGYRFLGGTSMATPHVSGVAALAWSLDPTASYQTIRDAILAGVDPVASLAGITVTGGRLNAFGTLMHVGMTVNSSTPEIGGIITALPTDFAIRFSRPYEPATIDAADLAVNGVPADSYTLVDERTVTFHYAASPVTAQGVQAMHMNAGAVQARADVGLVDPLLRTWDATFRYDALRMQVAATTPPDGSVATLPLTQLQVRFNEPYDPATIGASDLVLSQGSVVSFTLVDSATVEYALDGIDQEDPLAISMPAGAVADVYGNPMLAYLGAFRLDFGTLPFPAPLTALYPAGSLIYSASLSGAVGWDGDVDRFTLDLAAGQMLTVVVTPDAALRPTIALAGPLGSHGSVTATAVGARTVLQTVAIDVPGTYEIAIGGDSGSAGAYTIEVLLNAAGEEEWNAGANNDSLASAQDIEASFISLAGGGQRAAVMGFTEGLRATGPDGFGYQAVAVPYTFEDISATGTAVLVGADTDYKQIRPSGFQFPFYGVTYTNVILASNGTITFEWDRRNGTIYNGISGGEDLTSIPDVATISPLWSDFEIVGPGAGVYWEVRGSGSDQRLIVQWHNIRYDMPDLPSDLDFQAILYERDGSVRFNYKNVDDVWFGAYVGIKDTGIQGVNRLLLAHSHEPNDWVGTGQSTLIGRGLPGTTTSDFYKFSMAAGQQADVLLTALNRGNLEVEIQDASGTVLAGGAAGPGNVNRLAQFTAPADGIYYALVSGNGQVDYSLVVTRDADFELEGNNDSASAQSVQNGSVILGALDADQPSIQWLGNLVSAGAGGLDDPYAIIYGPDGNLYVSAKDINSVLRYDVVTGAPLPAPGKPGAEFVSPGAGGLSQARGIAFGPDGNLYVASTFTDAILRYDGATGEPLGAFVVAGVGGLDEPRGLLFHTDGLVTYLYVTSAGGVTDSVLRYDAVTGAPAGVSGLPGDAVFIASRSGGLDNPSVVIFHGGSFYVSSTNPNTSNSVLRYGIDGTFQGAFVPTGSGGLSGPVDLVFHDGYLYVTSWANNQVLRYDAATGAFVDEAANGGGLVRPIGLLFEPGGDFLVASGDTDEIRRYGLSSVRSGSTFVAPGSGGLTFATDLAFRPDGSLYVVNWQDPTAVLRYNVVTGEFIDEFANGGRVVYGQGMTFGPDGNLYVAGITYGLGAAGIVRRYDGATGAYLGPFAGGLGSPRKLTFGPDGHLYVVDNVLDGNLGPLARVVRFDASSGAKIDDFVPKGSGSASGLAFGPDGNGDGVPELFVSRRSSGEVLRYDGVTGAFIDRFVAFAGGSFGMAFGPDVSGDSIPELLVVDGWGNVLRYDGSNGAFIDVVASGAAGTVTLGPDGSLYVIGSEGGVLRFGAPNRDIFRMQLQSGDRVELATSTPLGDLNALDPLLRLYDASGTLVALDDNGASDGRNASLAYTVPAGGAGTYFLEIVPSDLTATPTTGEYVLSVTVSQPPEPPNDPPTANAAGPYSGTEDLSLLFDASGSSDLNGDALTYTWDFGDGTVVSTSEATIQHVYLWGGSFAVTLTVSDGRGGTASAGASALIKEVNDRPVARVSGRYSGTVGSAISMDASASSDFDNQDGTAANDQALTYLWDFGDGATASTSSVTVSHAYAAAGTYTVTLVVSDGAEDSTAVTTTATVVASSNINSTVSGSQFFNQATANYGNNHTVASDAQGNYVVVWEGNGVGDTQGIFFQRFNAAGVTLGSETLVNTATSGEQRDGMVAMDAGGKFIVAWTSWASGSPLIFARLYQADGTPLGNPFQVGKNTYSWPTGVGMDADGDFVVLYSSLTNSMKFTGRHEDFVQRYNAVGKAQGAAIKTASPRLINGTADIAMDANGNFAVTWDDVGGVFVQRYSPLGQAQGAVINISAETPSIAMDAAGSFVVNYKGGAQIFNADGTLRGSRITHSGTTTQRSAVAFEPDGETIVIAWQTAYGGQGNSDIRAQRFNAAGATPGQPLADSFVVNTTLDGDQMVPSVSLRADGGFVIVWSGNGPGDDSGIFGQRYAGDGQALAAASQSLSSKPSRSAIQTASTSTISAAPTAGAITPADQIFRDLGLASALTSQRQPVAAHSSAIERFVGWDQLAERAPAHQELATTRRVLIAAQEGSSWRLDAADHLRPRREWKSLTDTLDRLFASGEGLSLMDELLSSSFALFEAQIRQN